MRVEDGRGGDGKLVLLARLGLSNAVGSTRGNVGIAPARQAFARLLPGSEVRKLRYQFSRWSGRSQLHKFELLINTEVVSISNGRHVSRYPRRSCSASPSCGVPTYRDNLEDFRDERRIQVFEDPGRTSRGIKEKVTYRVSSSGPRTRCVWILEP